MSFNFNLFFGFVKKNFNIPEDELELVKNKFNFKIIILNKYNLLKKIYFKNLTIKLELLQKNKFKKYILYKDLIHEYNEYINIYNKFIYGFKYSSLSVEKLQINEENIVPQTEIYPYTIINYFYSFDKLKKKKLEENIIENYEIKGLICFLNYKNTKIKEEIKLYAICDEIHKKDLYVINLLDFIKKKNFTLFLNIKKIIKLFVIDEWKKYYSFCKKTYSKNNEENFFSNINVGMLCCLSFNKTDFSKKKILESFYCNDNLTDNDFHLHLYFMLYQYGKQSNKYNVQKINQDINTIIEVNNIKNISYELNQVKNFNFSIGFSKLTNDENICFLNFHNINILKLDYLMPLDEYYNFLFENKILYVNKKNAIIIKYNKLKIKTTLSDILYSNFLNINKKFNFNKLYLCEDNIYIPDIIIKYKQDITNNIIYKNLNQGYFIKKNNIVFKKNLNMNLEKLFNIDNDGIDWLHFINSNKDQNIKDINLDNIFSWFTSTYKLHLLENKKNCLYIKNFFTCTNIDYMFFKTLFKDVNINEILNHEENYNDIKTFLKFFNKFYVIENNLIIKKCDDFNKQEYFNYLFFIEILKIIFFLNEN